MTLIEKIQTVFPRTTEIPARLLNDIPCIQTGYLVNGEIREWDGL
jgi:glyceraldehyde-3-phosphate dehydrogenase (NADP+)